MLEKSTVLDAAHIVQSFIDFRLTELIDLLLLPINIVFKIISIRKALRLIHNCKYVRLDKIHNFCIKTFPVVHKNLTKAFSTLLDDPKPIHVFLSNEKTHMLYKKGRRVDPKNYTHITSLSFSYL